MQELQLGERYGCSRTPVREALRSLVEEGLVERVGRFYYVKRFSVAEVRELYELREALECAATRLATERASEEELLQLREHVVQHEIALRAGVTMENTTDQSIFHRQIGHLSGNRLISTELARLHEKVIFISRVLDIAKRDELIAEHKDHFRVVDAMIRRNADAAEAEIRYHIRNAVTLYIRYFQETEADEVVFNGQGLSPSS